MQIAELRARVQKRIKEGGRISIYLDEKQRNALVKAIYPHHVLLEYEIAGPFSRGTLRRSLTWFDMAVKLGAMKRPKEGEKYVTQ